MNEAARNRRQHALRRSHRTRNQIHLKPQVGCLVYRVGKFADDVAKHGGGIAAAGGETFERDAAPAQTRGAVGDGSLGGAAVVAGEVIL